MTIRAANNGNDNLNERLKLIKTLEHPALRTERLGRRNTYKNLNLCKNKQDEYDKIIRSASEFLSGIFPNSTSFSQTSEVPFDSKYTMKLIQDDDGSDKKDNFTFGTFSRSHTKKAEQKSTCQKEKTEQKTRRERSDSLQCHNESKGNTKDQLYTIEEAADFKLSDDESINEVNTMCKENKNEAKIYKLNTKEGENENTVGMQYRKISDMEESQIMLNNSEGDLILRRSPKSSDDTADEKSEAKQKFKEKINLVNYESQFDTELDVDDIHQDLSESHIQDEYEEEVNLILLHEGVSKFYEVEKRKEDLVTIDKTSIYDIIEIEYMDILKDIKEIENRSNNNFSPFIHPDQSEACIKDEYEDEIHFILLHEGVSEFDDVKERIIDLDNLNATVYHTDMSLIYDCIEMEYMDTVNENNKIENSLYDNILYNTANTVHTNDNAIIIPGIPHLANNIKIQGEDEIKNTMSTIEIIEDEYLRMQQRIMDTDANIYDFLLCRDEELSTKKFEDFKADVVIGNSSLALSNAKVGRLLDSNDNSNKDENSIQSDAKSIMIEYDTNRQSTKDSIIVDESKEENKNIYFNEDIQSMSKKEQIDRPVDSLDILKTRNKVARIEQRDTLSKETTENTDLIDVGGSTGKSKTQYVSMRTEQEWSTREANIYSTNSIETTDFINLTKQTHFTESIPKEDKTMEKTANITQNKRSKTENITNEIEELVQEKKTQNYDHETESIVVNKERKEKKYENHNSSKDSYLIPLATKKEDSFGNILDTAVTRSVQENIIEFKETFSKHATITTKIELKTDKNKHELEYVKLEVQNDEQDTRKLDENKFENHDLLPGEVNKEGSETNSFNLRQIQSLEAFPSHILNKTKEGSKHIHLSENNQSISMLNKDIAHTDVKIVSKLEQRDKLNEETWRNNELIDNKGMLGAPINESELKKAKEELGESESITSKETVYSKMKTKTTEPVYETSKTKHRDIEKNEADKDNFINEMETSIHERKMQENDNEAESTVSTKRRKEEKYQDQKLNIKLFPIPSVTEVNNVATSRAEKEEIVRPKDMTMKHSTKEADEIDTDENIIVEAKTVDQFNILSEVVIDSDLCSPGTSIRKKMNTESELNNKDQDRKDDKKTIISKIQENIQVIDLYERRIKSIAQTIIKHETACEENVKHFPELNVKDGQNKEKLKTKLNIAEINCFLKLVNNQAILCFIIYHIFQIGKDIMLFLLLLLLGLVLLYLTLDPSSLPHHGDDLPAVLPHVCDGAVPSKHEHLSHLPFLADSCTLDGYRLLASGALSLI